MDTTEGKPPRTDRGAPLERAAAVERPPAGDGGARGGRRYGVAIAVAAILVAIVASGLLAVVLVFPGRKNPGMPRSARELRASVRAARGYLNNEGRALASGKNEHATIYSVELKLDEKQNLVSGYEYVLYTNTTDGTLADVVFRVHANAAEVRGQGEEVTIGRVKAGGRSTPARIEGSLLSVAVPGGLAPGKQVLISFTFRERIPEIAVELGLSSLLGVTPSGGYGLFGRSDTIYNLGYAFPLVTRTYHGEWECREVPPYGDPGDLECSYFTVSVDVPDSFTVSAPGVPTATGGGGGRRTYKYAGGPMRDFSVQASPEYLFTRVYESGVELRTYYTGKGGEQGERILRYARQALRQFNAHFGAYPYRRLNVCEAPLAGGAAGMEFSGQVLIAGFMFGVGGIEPPDRPEDPGGGTVEKLLNDLAAGFGGSAVEFTVTHEVCHQWWGLVVGSDPIDHPWQDESLTNYSTVLYFRWQYGAEEARQQLESQVVSQYWAGSALGKGDSVVDRQLYEFGDRYTYAAAVYGKGALMFESLEQMLGGVVFERDLRAYYHDYSFLVASPEDLLAVFQARPSDPEAVTVLFRRWLKEEHGGEDITLSPSGGNIVKSLRKFLESLGETDPGPLEDLREDYTDGGTAPRSQPRSTEPAPTI